jgi:hypothetical protein
MDGAPGEYGWLAVKQILRLRRRMTKWGKARLTKFGGLRRRFPAGMTNKEDG